MVRLVLPRSMVRSMVLLYRFNDFCDEVVAAELRHQVNTLCPGLDRLDQGYCQFHTHFRTILSGHFHTPASLLRDGYPGYFIVQKTDMPRADQRQDAHQHRPVERTV